MKFTVGTIASLTLPAGKSDAIFFDDDVGGFGLRLRAAGSKNWIFQYKLGDKQRRLSFGTFPAMGLEQARKAASELHARVRLGGDPAADKFKARAQVAETVEAVIRRFLQRQKQHLRPRSYGEVERHLLVHARSRHKEPIAKVDPPRRRDPAIGIAGQCPPRSRLAQCFLQLGDARGSGRRQSGGVHQ